MHVKLVTEQSRIAFSKTKQLLVYVETVCSVLFEELGDTVHVLEL